MTRKTEPERIVFEPFSPPPPMFMKVEGISKANPKPGFLSSPCIIRVPLFPTIRFFKIGGPKKEGPKGATQGPRAKQSRVKTFIRVTAGLPEARPSPLRVPGAGLADLGLRG